MQRLIKLRPTTNHPHHQSHHHFSANMNESTKHRNKLLQERDDSVILLERQQCSRISETVAEPVSDVKVHHNAYTVNILVDSWLELFNHGVTYPRWKVTCDVLIYRNLLARERC
jgi:hypothetical protein